KQLRLETQVDSDLPLVKVDERRIRQVLINLLTNAAKFTPDGGCITLSATVVPDSTEAITPTSRLRFSVADTGIGIAPADMDRLFQPFIQVDSALNRKYEGTGLGLSLVKHLVELHGGQVGVVSQVGHGSCFFIDLPTTDETLRPCVMADPRVALMPSQALSPLILLAEDNAANSCTVSGYLSAKGYRVLLAQNGQEAIELAQAENPDLILMDIQMPIVDGFEAMTRIRQAQESAEIPIIALTALAMERDRRRCLDSGANDYLSKPIKLQQLVTTIQQHLVAL
ncbi:response regulator, partial [filamentous cyanobacterium LEGE 11480]